MVKFEQKEFLAPLAAITAASSVIGVGTGIKSAADSGTANELQEQMIQQQKIDSYKQQKAQEDQLNAVNKLTDATNNLANSPAGKNPAVKGMVANAANNISSNMAPTARAYSEVKFKRKEFGLGAVLANPKVIAGFETMGAVSGVQDAANGIKNVKNMRSELEAMKSQSNSIGAQSSNLANSLNETTNNLNTMAKSYSETNQSTIKFRQKSFGFLNNVVRKYNRSEVGKAINGLGKVAADMAWDHRGKIVGGTLAGVGMAAIHYGVNKGIQHNMNKNGIDMAAIRDMQKEDQQASQYYPSPYRDMSQRQQMYADTDGLKREIGRDQFGNYTNWEYRNKAGQLVKKGAMTNGQWAGQMVKENAFGPMSLVFSGAFEIPTVVGYSKEKNNLKALSDMARARKGLAPLPMKKASNNQQPVSQQPMQPQQQRMYGAVGHWISNAIRGVKKWATAPGQNTLAAVDKMSGGGGVKGVNNMKTRLTQAGDEYGSEFLKKAGNWVGNHKKLALAGSIGLGFKVMGDTMNLGENIVNKPMRAIDPNAYAYDDYKEQQIQ
jgi:hypothetical protein